MCKCKKNICKFQIYVCNQYCSAWFTIELYFLLANNLLNHMSQIYIMYTKLYNNYRNLYFKTIHYGSHVGQLTPHLSHIRFKYSA